MPAGSGVEVVAIDTPALGDRSYLAHDGEVALVIDPQRDIDRLPAADGDVIDVGPVMRVRVLATPGHTFTHLSYVLEAAGHAHAVFTGGSLLYGSTGRPDLLGRAHAAELAHAQYASAHRLAAELPADTDVYPTHGFGSFCSATQSEGTWSTVGREQQVNPVLRLDQERYVAELLAGLDAFPAYYAHMGPANAAGHLAGTFGFDLDGSFATYLGWLIPWGTPLTLLGRTPEQVAEAQRELARIGIDRPAAAAASFLDAAGRTVVAVDDEYDRAARAGLPAAGHPVQATAK